MSEEQELITKSFQRGGEKAWAVARREGEELREAWAWTPDTKQVQQAAGDDAKALITAVNTAGGEVRDIAPHVLALPTGFDLQVHLRFPGQEGKETLGGGLAAAFIGGFDSIVTMPNTAPFLDRPERLKEAIDAAQARFPVQPGTANIGFTAAGTIEMQGQEPTDIAGLVQAGAVAITDDGWGVRSEDAMAEIFRRCRDADVAFLQHAETPDHGGCASGSAFQGENDLPEYPRTAESSMVERDIRILQDVEGARYHVLHISTRETLQAIARGKEQGLNITCEVTPHHLYFANTDIPGAFGPPGTYFKMNPPLFAPEDRQALREALASGLIDFVSTDHAPHTEESKSAEWKVAPFGTRGLETALPVLISLMWDGVITEERLREVYSLAARKVMPAGEWSQPRGMLFIDPHQEFVVGERDLPGISRNSCFVGQKLRGRMLMRAEPGALFFR